MCSGDPSTWGLVMSSCLAWGILVCSQMSMLRLRDWALCSLGLCLRAVLGGFTVAMAPERSYERHCPFAKGLQRRTMTITLASQIHNNYLAQDCDRAFFLLCSAAASLWSIVSYNLILRSRNEMVRMTDSGLHQQEYGFTRN